MHLLNAFSANMLADFPASVTFTELGIAGAALLVATTETTSAVGHADTAAVFSAVLSAEALQPLTVACNRSTVVLSAGDCAILGQYSGPRLPEGATQLPEGAEIKWLLVRVG